MWGNQKGWMISGCIVLATIALYAYLIFGSGISDPTSLTTAPGAMAAIELPASPRALLPSAGGSGDGYRQAIATYKADPATYDNYLESGKINTPAFKKLKAIDQIVSAAGSGGAVFGGNPAEIVTYNPMQIAALKPIDQLAHVALRLGLQFNAAKKHDQAKEYLLAAYSLGYSLANERLTFSEFRLGQDVMRDAALNLSTIDTVNGDKFKAIDPAFKAMMDKLDKTFVPLLNPANDAVADVNAGDVFNLAQHSDERMWKIEAIMLLGHFRYNAAHAGDQRGASVVLARLAGDSDPAVATAVKAAQDLTLAEHRDSVNLPQ